MPEPSSHDMILGEMRGQLRELVHSANNLSMKVDGLSREVIGLGPLAADIADLKTRMGAIETKENRKEGAAGVVTTILKSPAIAWFVGAVITVWAIFTGKINV